MEIGARRDSDQLVLENARGAGVGKFLLVQNDASVELLMSSERDRRIDMIRNALESLPELQQTTVRFLLGGLSYEEMAAKMDKTPGAVRMLRHRAVDNLRRMLRPPR